MATTLVQCCARLAECPQLQVAFPGSLLYNLTEQSYWSIQEASLSPSCIITPTTTKHVAETISILVDEGCDFAIKSQGHAPAAGFANIDNGITIDMTGMIDIALSQDHSIVSIGAGASWLDVYTYLDAFNKTVAGGRNGAVGVGGLTLGGGISYFSPQVGFTCDTVTNFEVVLANGHVVNANAQHNSDLFRALKGGTNNYGIVTRFDFDTIDYTEILGGSIAQDISHRNAVFEAFANIANAPQYDVHASIVTSLIFNSTSKKWTLASTPAYTAPVLRPPVYEQLFAVPNISDTLHLTKLHTFANESATPPLNWLFYTGTYGVSAKLLNNIFDICNETLYDFDPPGHVTWALAIEPLPTIFVSRGARKNSLGTSPTDKNGFILLVSPLSPLSSSNAQIHAVATDLMGKINAEAEKAGLLHPFVYANYADSTQRPFASYGEANLAFLKKTARKYDPKGVFQRLVPGGFKLQAPTTP